jgi:hypothetical protein
LKKFPGLIPRTPVKGKGGKGGRKGKRRGLGMQMSRRRGVVWDREREEGMRVIQRKEIGREEGKGRKEMTWPIYKIHGSATALK